MSRSQVRGLRVTGGSVRGLRNRGVPGPILRPVGSQDGQELTGDREPGEGSGALEIVIHNPDVWESFSFFPEIERGSRSLRIGSSVLPETSSSSPLGGVRKGHSMYSFCLYQLNS